MAPENNPNNSNTQSSTNPRGIKQATQVLLAFITYQWSQAKQSEVQRVPKTSSVLTIAITSAIVCLVHIPAVLARQWVVLDNNPIVSVDVDSIKGEGDSRTFWSRVIYDEDQYLVGSRFRFSTTLVYVDCQAERIGSIKTVFYDQDGKVVESVDYGYAAASMNARLVVPDTIGEIQLRYICGRRTPNNGYSRRRNYPSNLQVTTPISKQGAVDIINTWLRVKREIFAPPYNLSKVENLTTGEFYQELVSVNGLVNWLKNNNAWYKYDLQAIEQTRLFATSKTGKAIIELRITEYVTYYQNSTVVPNKSGRKTTNVRYYLERSGNQWKISRYLVIP